MTVVPALSLVISFLLLALAERLRPLRRAFAWRRWLVNVALFALAMALVTGLMGLTGLTPEETGALGALWLVLFALVVLDLGQWSFHLAEHRFAPLWRIHRVHHTDRDMDITTGLRFHPLETLLRTCVTLAIALLLALPLSLVLLYAALSYAANHFAHADISLPPRLDRVLRWVIVTPDMHRIHHSEVIEEQGSNLVAIFSFWDRLFGTYVEAPAQPADRMPLGVTGFKDPRHGRFAWMLADPLLDDAGNWPSPSAR